MNKYLISLPLLFLFSIANAQLSKIGFTVNNFIHQKSDFTFLNEVDTRGAFLEPTATFGQHYLLTKESNICNKLSFSYGLGVGYTRIKYRYRRSEEFLSLGFENRFTESRGGNSNTMFVAPVGLLYKIFGNEKSALFLNINSKVIYALRTRITFGASSSNEFESKRVYLAETPINNENSLDFTIGTALDYRRRIAESPYWWKIELNYNHALTDYYTGTATLFGDAENIDIEVENKLTHVGLAVGILRSL